MNDTAIPTATTTTALASIWSRFLALLIDSMILLVPGALLHIGFPIAGPLLLSFFYYPIFHASPLEATIGKKALGIRVTDTQGNTLTLQMAYIRFLVAVASACFLFAGHFVAFFTPKRQALHDLVADSIVVEGVRPEIGVLDAWVATIRRLLGIRTDVSTPPPTTGAPKGSRDDVKRRLDELERLYELKQKGVISEEEYQRMRQELV